MSKELSRREFLWKAGAGTALAVGATASTISAENRLAFFGSAVGAVTAGILVSPILMSDDASRSTKTALLKTVAASSLAGGAAGLLIGKLSRPNR